MKSDGDIIKETSNWIKKVVIGCNFCPFAASVFKNESIGFTVNRSKEMRAVLIHFANEINKLDVDETIETSIIILPDTFTDFKKYLDLIELCNQMVKDLKKEGIYQVASFHPEYIFSGSSKKDPSNYTNRSVYPLIHILREDSITKALANFERPETIPAKNIKFTESKGIVFMENLRQECFINEDSEKSNL